MKIANEILKRTTKCVYNFECLKDENHICRTAKVERCVDDKVHFVACKDWYCHYRMPLGRASICHCPVKIEMYKNKSAEGKQEKK